MLLIEVYLHYMVKNTTVRCSPKHYKDGLQMIFLMNYDTLASYTYQESYQRLYIALLTETEYLYFSYKCKALIMQVNINITKTKIQEKRYWVKTPLLNRSDFDIENKLLTELLTVDGEFQNFTRLAFQKFAELHEKVASLISKEDAYEKSDYFKIRLGITLQCLASGNSYKLLEFLSRLSRVTIGNFVPEVCNAVITLLTRSRTLTPYHVKQLFSGWTLENVGVCSNHHFYKLFNIIHSRMKQIAFKM
ncbi:unnamed protein product [Callosobruchus maculatus]|uniref:Uncharacterized protein n=1 Tax=Callosobruchus maculatus TaxID=64391 RepID=A0A653CFX7_CALMS|nr:unnamed protein product [Callosobruchus maculatus]